MTTVERIEIIPLVEVPIIKETLSRIGIANKKEKILYPSCYLLEDDDKYFIFHFKELFLLRHEESSYSNISEDDLVRKISIINLLVKWELISIHEKVEMDTMYVFTIPFKNKSEWSIRHKFNLESL